MKLAAFAFLADENIHPDVIAHMRQQGREIVSVKEVGLGGGKDSAILAYALQQGLVVLTHDSDFGRLAFLHGQAFSGIIYLRPGHIRPAFTIATLEHVFSLGIEVRFPFVIIAERVGEIVKVRVRQT